MIYVIRQLIAIAKAQILVTAAHNMAIVGAQTLTAPLAARMAFVHAI